MHGLTSEAILWLKAWPPVPIEFNLKLFALKILSTNAGFKCVSKFFFSEEFMINLFEFYLIHTTKKADEIRFKCRVVFTLLWILGNLIYLTTLFIVKICFNHSFSSFQWFWLKNSSWAQKIWTERRLWINEIAKKKYCFKKWTQSDISQTDSALIQK